MALYQGNILLSGGNNEAPDEIFVAEFNVTTFSEIQTAYNEGKTIFLKHSNTLYNMTAYSNSMITFSGFRNNAEFVYRYTVDSSNSWNYEGVPQTPKSHASTHKTGGTDVITPASIGAAPTNHASTDYSYGKANAEYFGHVKLYSKTDSTSGDSAGVAATPYAVKLAYDKATAAQTTADNAATAAGNAASAASAAQTTATNVAAAVSASAAQIGDLKITTRTDLGDDWIIPNGALLDATKYPALDAMITNRSSDRFDVPGGYVYGCEYANGIFVGLGYGGASAYTGVFTSKTKDYLPDGLNVSQLMGSYSPSEQCPVKYDPSTGIWCMASKVNGIIYSWATKDPMSGSWTCKTIQSSNTQIDLGDMHYYNGTWVAVGGYLKATSQYSFTASTYVWVTTDPINGTWTQYTISDQYFLNASQTCIYCYNGTWVIAMTQKPQYNASSNKNGNFVVVYWTNTPTGTWSSKTISGPSNSSATPAVASLYCHDGQWVIIGDQSGYTNDYWTTTNPSGTWTTGSCDGVNDARERCIIWDNGYWYLLDNTGTGTSYTTAGYAYSTTLDGPWTAVSLSTTNGATPRCICARDGVLAMIHTNSTSQTGVFLAKHIPLLTNPITGAHLYMKAK